MHVSDPSTPGIQAKLDQVFQEQESAQFGSGRHAFLFKPGTYENLNAQIGFYTQVLGLGLRPDDTTINGDITVDAGWFNGNATQNFWRGAENLAVKPVNGTNRWAVSQAASFRRMHVKGGASTSRPTATAGPAAATSPTARSTARSATTRSSSGTPATAPSAAGPTASGTRSSQASRALPPPASPSPATPLDTTPISREKPFLYLDGDEYKVFAPAKRTNAAHHLGERHPAGRVGPAGQVLRRRARRPPPPSTPPLAQGLHLLFTPPASTTSTRRSTSTGRTPSCWASASPRSSRTTG